MPHSRPDAESLMWWVEYVEFWEKRIVLKMTKKRRKCQSNTGISLVEIALS